MDKYQFASIGISFLALIISASTGYFQYQTRQDAVEERVKLEVKMTNDGLPLSPLDLRIISGVEERENLEAAIFVTNTGSTSIRLLEVGYHDYDMPNHVYYSSGEKAKNLSPGEQTYFPMENNLVKINNQLLNSFQLGQDKSAKIFAVTTKGTRISVPAIIEVAN